MTKSKRLSIYSCMLTGNRYCIQHLWQGERIGPDERHQQVSQLCFWDNRKWLPVDTQKGRKLWSFQCHCWPTCDGEVPSPSHLPRCKTIHDCVNTFLSLIPRASTSSFFNMQKKKKGVVEVWKSGHMLWMCSGSAHCVPPGEKQPDEQSQIAWAQWDCEITNYYVTLPLQQ